MENENGYVIYPASVGSMDLDAAKTFAQQWSADDRGVDYRVKDCDTEKTIAVFRNGIEVKP